MIFIADQPPVQIAPAPIASRNILIWGDGAAQASMIAAFEKKAWTWAKLSLGGRTDAVLLVPPASVSDDEVTQLIAQINAGKFGKLNAGYGQLGNP
ncbi:hypothetical protein [uncultured Sphingomonas sp.]|uniref:hypothetical protein n=1 Tax=uncultured Sphingomonas sp. TaxID=158754 RepID=UPI0025F0F39D|nr:hypothetical protein [uncultured Sphingomonas sp.]